MSAANSSAKKRRAPPSIEPPKSANNTIAPMNSPATTGLTLPQVISLIDKRLVNLEVLTKKLSDNATTNPSGTGNSDTEDQDAFISEFQERFEVMVEEIANLKNIVMSLQAYTMDVNKLLLEERNDQSDKHSRPTFSIHDGTASVTMNAQSLIVNPDSEDEEDEPEQPPVGTVKWK